MQIYPFLRFNDGKCLEALRFYKDAFGGGKVSYMTLGESPMAEHATDATRNLIMHSEFSHKGITFQASDMMRDKAVMGDHLGISLLCESEEELTSIFNKLAEGGDVFMAPEKQFWGGLYAMVTDKYGKEWMLNYQMDPFDPSKMKTLE